MYDQQGIELVEFGSQVAIIDDNENDAAPIEEVFNDLNIGNQYFKVDYIEPKYPDHPLENIKLVFLDLHYNEGFGVDFNPYACVDWLDKIVPKGKKYTLVIWSRDVDKTDELIATISEMGATLPSIVARKSKPLYLNDNVEDNIKKMLAELGIRLKELEIDVHEFPGKILEIEEDSVLINCLINEEPKFFEIRRFDLLPFKDYINLELGQFLNITITTKPGSRTIDFESESNDISEKFIKPDDPEEFGSLDWLNTHEA